MEDNSKGFKASKPHNRPRRSANGSGGSAGTQAEPRGAGRVMVPFFADGEDKDATFLKLSDFPAKGSRQWHGPRRPSSQGSPFSQFIGREVGVNTLPIGQFSLVAGGGQPAKAGVAHLKSTGAKIAGGAKGPHMYGRRSDSKCDSTDYSDGHSGKPRYNYASSHSTDTLCNGELDGCGGLREAPSVGRIGSPGPGRPARREKDSVWASIDAIRRLTCTYSKRVAPRKTSDIQVRLGLLSKPSAKTPEMKSSKSPVADPPYAFSKYVRSPDPSSIPVPELR
ncbi:conjugal transfer protein, putative [Babesia caballi]|uniref:Conjugal transfer protein, putative n=1 Tax=Babesia caballi TaxID=5871 RepID=A0AAV4LMP3_BABCB|nr:conjugal transfer protein, putative [Babesia caballi]